MDRPTGTHQAEPMESCGSWGLEVGNLEDTTRRHTELTNLGLPDLTETWPHTREHAGAGLLANMQLRLHMGPSCGVGLVSVLVCYQPVDPLPSTWMA